MRYAFLLLLIIMLIYDDGDRAKALPAVADDIQPASLVEFDREPEQLARELEKRKALQAECFETMEMVYQRTGDREARKIIDFLRSNAFVAQPYGAGGILVLEDAGDRVFPIAISVVTEPDLDKFPDLRERIGRGNAAGGFNVDSPRAIEVVYIGMSPLWRGLMLLHEGAHALSMHDTPYDWDDPRVNAGKEVMVHEFESRLLSKLGGKPYARLLEREIRRIRDVEKKVVHAGDDIVFVGRSVYDPVLDSIFGPAQSPFEKALRQTHVHIGAEFLHLNRRYRHRPKVAAAIKALWYHELRVRSSGERSEE